MGALAFRASLGEVIAGNFSYSTSMKSRAFRAAAFVSAATSAMASPIYLVSSFTPTSTGQSLVTSPLQRTPGRSAAVKTTATPGNVFALDTSMETTRDLG